MMLYSALFDHFEWADAEARAALYTLHDASPERARAATIYAHLAAATHVWLARLQNRTPEHPIWPELTLAEAAALAAESSAGLRAIVDEGEATLAREIEYRNSAGQPFRNTIGDILTHVVLHGSYHRGQLALLVRQGGGAPANTDYITFVRSLSPT